MVRGLERRKIFLSDRDKTDLIERFSAVLPKAGAGIYAWSFLPNHFHLLIRTGRMALSSVMRRILTGYAVSFNRRHRRSGYLFQNRYKSILVEEEPYLLELVRYIHLNAVRAKLVEDVDELESYPWAGHSVLMGKMDRPWQDCGFVLEQFGKNTKKGRGAYKRFIREGVDQGRREELTGGGLIRSAGGWETVKALRRGREKWTHDERVLGSSEFVEGILRELEREEKREKTRGKVSEETVLTLVEEIGSRLGLTVGELMTGSRRRRVVEGRNLISFAVVRGYGMSLGEAGKLLNISKQSVLRGVERGPDGFQQRGWCLGDFTK
jgi:REP element-mobilizing transposase RayT